jgi:hypothetical protein
LETQIQLARRHAPLILFVSRQQPVMLVGLSYVPGVVTFVYVARFLPGGEQDLAGFGSKAKT